MYGIHTGYVARGGLATGGSVTGDMLKAASIHPLLIYSISQEQIYHSLLSGVYLAVHPEFCLIHEAVT